MTMTERTLNLLAQLLWSAHREVESYQQIESQKTGREIAWQQAEQEWLQKHFPDWKSYHWRVAVEQATHLPQRQPVEPLPLAQSIRGQRFNRDHTETPAFTRLANNQRMETV